MPTALPTQIEAVVFDGVSPAYRDVRTPHAAVFPWLLSFVDVAGDTIDMSGTSGSPSVGWTARWLISSSAGVVLTVQSSTATAGGSQITFPDLVDGEVQVLLSATDAATLSGFLEHTLYLTDQFGNAYKAVYGMLYPSSDSG
jgi:hypothetical protein